VIVARRDGNSAQITGWNSSLSKGALKQALAGYWFEVLVFCAAGQFIAAIGKAKGWWWVSGFFFGYVIVTMAIAFKSYDFHSYIDQFAEQVRLPAETLKTAVRNRWILLCTAVSLVNVPIIWFCYVRSKHSL